MSRRVVSSPHILSEVCGRIHVVRFEGDFMANQPLPPTSQSKPKRILHMTKFQEFMNQHQLRQYRLHKLTGFTKSQISEWQRGIHRPSLKSARRIAIALQMSIQQLKSQIELRENCQNAISPDGQFVGRTRQNSIAMGQR